MIINDLSRLCFSSLIMMTVTCYFLKQYQIIERIKQHAVFKKLLTGMNLASSAGALVLLSNNFYLGLIGVYLSIILWGIQFSNRNSEWLRPLAINAALVLVTLLFLWHFETMSLWSKLWAIMRYGVFGMF